MSGGLSVRLDFGDEPLLGAVKYANRKAMRAAAAYVRRVAVNSVHRSRKASAAGTEFRALSRGLHDERPCVHVGIVRRATEDDVPALIDFAQALGRSFLHRRLADATCTGVAFDPVYSPSHLRDKGLFVSVMELTFQGAG